MCRAVWAFSPEDVERLKKHWDDVISMFPKHERIHPTEEKTKVCECGKIHILFISEPYRCNNTENVSWNFYKGFIHFVAVALSSISFYNFSQTDRPVERMFLALLFAILAVFFFGAD